MELLICQLFQIAGTLDEHMHLLLPVLIRLFKVDASVEIRRAAIKTLTKLIPRVQASFCLCPFPLAYFSHSLEFIYVLQIFNAD